MNTRKTQIERTQETLFPSPSNPKQPP